MNKNLLIIVSFVVVLVGAGAFALSQLQGQSGRGNFSPTPQSTPSAIGQTNSPLQSQEASSSATTVDGQFTLEDVAKHSTPDDCWIVIEGMVYDVTAYIAQQRHPGGAAILGGCGKDATEFFNMRPQDGKPHSDSARSTLSRFKIGSLKK